MKSVKKHIIISTVLCALTLAVLIAFSGKLPESVPVHFDSAGNANSFWPRSLWCSRILCPAQSDC